MEIYLSPIRLVKYHPSPNLADEKNRVLEELYQSGNQELQVESVKYSKDDVLRSFELLANTENYKFHLTIYKNRDLLNFLENKERDYSNLIQALKWGSFDNRLKEFILPYYACSYQLFLIKYLSDSSVSSVKRILEFNSFLTEKYITKTEKAINTFISLSISKIKDVLNQKSIAEQYRSLKPFISREKLMCFNLLAAEYSIQISDYQEMLVKIAMHFAEQDNKGAVKEIVENLKATGYQTHIELTTTVKQKIPESQVHKKTTGHKPFIFLVAAFIVLLGIALPIYFKQTKQQEVEHAFNQNFVPELEEKEMRKSNLISIAPLSQSLNKYYVKQVDSDMVRYYYAQGYKDLIEQTPDNQIKIRTVKRSKPYRRLLGDDEFVDRDSITNDIDRFLKLNNHTSYDAVIFLVRDATKIAAHSYIYAQEEKLLEFMPQYEGETKDYLVYVYLGKDWNDFFRLRVGEKGLNGLFEYQPENYAGLQFTGLTISCKTHGNETSTTIIEIQEERRNKINVVVRETNLINQ